MAKKKAAASNDATREKARQLREAQAKADKRTRTIITVSVVVLILAIAVAVVFVVVNRPTPEKAAETLPEQFRDGAPIIVSSQGIGVEDPNAENLTLYYDYTCPACTQLEVALRPGLLDSALNGDYNLELQPVITAGGPYNVAATAGALAVAGQAPDQFLEFHEALTDYFFEEAINGGNTDYQNLEASKKVVADIAAESGVPADVIATFDTDAAQAYLNTSTSTWVSADIEGRENVATPEFVAHNRSIDRSASSPEQLLQDLIAAVNQTS